MEKLNRLTAKIFGETASTTNTPKEIGQFGSAKAGTYNATGDVATIQSLPAWSNGWIDAVTPTGQFPPLPEMTGVHKVLSYQNAYLLQQGIPEWDSATTYYENGFCTYNGIIYKSILDENINNQPDETPGAWFEYGSGDYANQDINNLTTLGNSRLQYAPFAINNGSVVNGNNATLQSESYIQSYSTPGTYTLEITESGNYEIEMYGAGGGWANTAWVTDTVYHNTASGGSGAGFKGVVTLAQGSYTVTVGAGGSSVNGGTSAATGGNGGSTQLNNLIIAGGGTGAYSQVASVVVGQGGNVTIDSSVTIISTSLNSSGRNGTYTGGAYSAGPSVVQGGSSLYDNTQTGFGAGGGYPNNAVNGYFKITKLAGNANIIFCNPCTLTTADGRTFVDSEIRTRDVSAWANNIDYAVFKNVATNVLSTQIADRFSVSKTVPINASIVGSLTNNNGVLSGFSTANYGRIPINFTPSNQTWEYCFKFTTGSDITSMQAISSDKHCWYSGDNSQRWGVYILIENSKIYVQANNGVVSGSDYPTFISHTIDVNPNTEYKVRFEFTGTAYNTYVSINGASETLAQTTASTTVVTSSGQNPYIGIIYSQHNSNYYAPFLGSIDLNESYIKINNSIHWLGTKDYWLDISAIPANFKINEGNNWVINNNLVWIGNFTKTNNAVTTVSNRKFNDSGYLVDRHIDGIVETYVNGTSWYRVYSDGWCEQGGRKTGASGQTITLMKSYANTNYHLSGSMLGSAYNTIVAFGIIDSSSFVVHTASGGQSYNSTASWLACGYLA